MFQDFVFKSVQDPSKAVVKSTLSGALTSLREDAECTQSLELMHYGRHQNALRTQLALGNDRSILAELFTLGGWTGDKNVAELAYLTAAPFIAMLGAAGFFKTDRPETVRGLLDTAEVKLVASKLFKHANLTAEIPASRQVTVCRSVKAGTRLACSLVCLFV